MLDRTHARPSAHCLTRLIERGITLAEVLQVLADGVFIGYSRTGAAPQPETYLGFVARPTANDPARTLPIHVVAVEDAVSGETVLITAYWVNPDLWDATFTRRIK